MSKHSNPLVEPHKSFQYVSLDNAQLGASEKVTIENPAAHFSVTQFRLLTIQEQLNLLAQVAVELTRHDWGEKAPLQLRSIRAALTGDITHEAATHYYSHNSPRALELWLQEGLRYEQTREMIVETFLSDLSNQLPAIACTLAHIYNGGFYGLLTARGDRDVSHKEQIRYIGEMFGFGTPPELAYYINDQERSKRLGGSSATRKATVLMNFATGFKQDEDGHFVEMTVGKRFDEVGFIDDEAKNLKAVMHCLVRGVFTDVLYAVGWAHRTPFLEEQLNNKSLAVTEAAFNLKGAAATADPSFWFGVVDDLLKVYTSSTGRFSDRGALIDELKAKKQWIPDIIKVYDANTMAVQPSIDTLRSIFNRREPIVMGTQRSILFNDIDGTLLKVNAGFPIFRKDDPTQKALARITQEEFAREPDPNYWLQAVSAQHDLKPEQLVFSWDHFRNPVTVREDILEGCYRRYINKKALPEQ
jgi:hypothetical protein